MSNHRDLCLCGHDWIKHTPKGDVYPCTIEGCDCGCVLAPAAWYALSVAMRPCAVCRTRRDLHGHHVVSRQRCKRRAVELGLDPAALMWDHRNALALCATDHMKFHSASQRIPLSLVPEPARAFAEQYGLEWSIERDYPEGPSDRLRM